MHEPLVCTIQYRDAKFTISQKGRRSPSIHQLSFPFLSKESNLCAQAFLPHLDALDVQTGLVAFAPGGQPFVLGFPEVERGAFAGVDPWLLTDAVAGGGEGRCQ